MKATASTTVSDAQIAAVVGDLRDGSPALTTTLIGLIAMRLQAANAFADVLAAPQQWVVDMSWPQFTIEMVDVFPHLEASPADSAHLPDLVHRIAGWPLPPSTDHSARGRLALRILDHDASARGRTGDHYTPACLVELMTRLTAPRSGERIHDPFSRAGELSAGAAVTLPVGGAAQLSADTASADALRLTRAVLLLTGMSVDARTRPVLDDGRRGSCDVVLLNPPFGIPWPEVDHGRWRYGQPPKHNANFAWLQHAVNLLSPGGRAAVLMASNAGTSTNPTERQIRDAMLRGGVVDAVIALPDRLFPSTPIAPSLWLLRPPRPEPVPDVLLVDATRQGVLERSRRVLSDAEIATVLDACHFDDQGRRDAIAGFSVLLSVAELTSTGAGLNPRALVRPPAVRRQLGDGAGRLDRAAGDRAMLRERLHDLQELTNRHLSAIADLRHASTPARQTKLAAVSTLKSGPGKFDDEPGAPSAEVVVPRSLRHNRIVAAGVLASPGAAPATSYRLEEGDVVCVRVGQLGRQGVVTADEAGWLLGPGCLRVRPGADVDARYLVHVLGSSRALDWLDRHATGSAIRGVSARVLGELPLDLPPIDEQRRIGALLGTFDDEAEVLDRAAAAISAVRDAASALLVPGRSMG